MRRIIYLLAMVCIVTSTQATVYFTIAPGSGYSEPLSAGDVIEVDVVTQPAQVGEVLINSYWEFSINSYTLGELYTTPGAFVLGGSGNLTGSDSLTVDPYFYADGVRLHIWSRLVQQQYHSYSSNILQVQPTMLSTPSTTVWGLILLLLAVPAIIIWRR